MENDKRECKRCKGTTNIHSPGFTSVEGKVYPDTDTPCRYCQNGYYPPIDLNALVGIIMATKGKNKGKLRATMTSALGSYDIAASRAYYVWRLARFHGGKDMTMPVMADMGVRNDPFKKELDLLADAVAKATFGTDLAAALRWKGLLG